MKMAFDIDGVICDFLKPLRRLILDKFNHDIYLDKEPQYFISIDGIPDYIVGKEIDNLMIYNSITFEPLEYAVEYLYKFQEEIKIPITFITSRWKELNVITSAWINLHVPGLEFKIINTGDNNKFIYTKDLDVFIDDVIENFDDDFLNGKKLGFLVRQPHNKIKIENGESKNLNLVNNIKDVYNILFNKR